MMTFRVLKTILLTVLLCLSGTITAQTSEEEFLNDPVHKRLYARFLDLYNDPSQPEEYYKAVDSLAMYYRKHDLTSQYYKTRLNICIYDAEHNHLARAMKQAREMLAEMEEEKFDAYYQVYTALGTIYENRGNYYMARHFYEESVNTLSLEDPKFKMAAYSRFANLMMFQEPVIAKQWNDRYYDLCLSSPDYYQVYLYINCMISFALNNEHDFRHYHQAFLDFHNRNNQTDSYGMEAMKVAELAFDNQFERALSLLDQKKTSDLNDMATYDMRTIIYKRMNRSDLVIENLEKRQKCIDSLNSDMLFDNLNEINAAAGVSSAKNKALRDHKRLLKIITLLSFIIIAMLIFWMIHSRRIRNNLQEKNNQLRSALVMAEEGEKMKNEFVRSVSHEIRTPLNAIIGFNELLNTPDVDITPEERKGLLLRISDNVKAITNIVDEMLSVADKESNEFYPKLGKIYCNNFFSGLLYEHRAKVSSSIELNYTTRVINRFQIETNEEGLRKVMEQLIQNAIKFTKRGFIRLHCEKSDDEKMLLVSLTDSGCGITEEQRSKIFESFYKADMFEQGIGLGLTVSRKIAQKLGGDLTLDETYTEGARFVLSLPIE